MGQNRGSGLREEKETHGKHPEEEVNYDGTIHRKSSGDRCGVDHRIDNKEGDGVKCQLQ